MTYIYFREPASSYDELDVLTEEEEQAQEARLHQLDALLDFIAHWDQEWTPSVVEYATSLYTTSLVSPSDALDWPFDIYPEAEAVTDMYAREQ